MDRTGLTFGRRVQDLQSLETLAKVERTGCRDMDEFYGLLKGSGPDSALWESLITTVTVGETYFFRNSAHFDALRRHILPDLIARRRHDRRLRIWSAGCATGEEPYSIAILLLEILPDADRWNISILATDINKRFLQKAHEGCYGEWSFRGTDPAIQKRYFIRRNGLFELRSDVRKMVHFAYLNLVDDAYPSLPTNTNAMDLILCRNVAIYMTASQIRKIAIKFYHSLMPDGLLIVAPSETDSDVYSQFQVENINGAFIYRKAAGSQTSAAGLAPKPDAGSLLGRLKKVRPIQDPITQPAHQNDLYKNGLDLVKQGCFKEAIACFQDHLKHDSNSAPACNQIARLKADDGLLEEARRYAGQSIRLDPLLVEAHYTLALILQEEKEIDMAINQFNKALYLDPDFVLAHFSLANLYRKLNRPEAAARHRSQTIRLSTRIPPEEEIPCSDGLTGAQLVLMMKTYKEKSGMENGE